MVTKEDDVTNSVSVFIAPDKLITFSMEDRDANEFAIVLAGYYRLIVGKCNVVIITIIILLCKPLKREHAYALHIYI